MINLQLAQTKWEQLLELLEKNEAKWEVQTAINANVQLQINNLCAAITNLQKAIDSHEKDLRELNTTDIPEEVQEILGTME